MGDEYLTDQWGQIIKSQGVPVKRGSGVQPREEGPAHRGIGKRHRDNRKGSPYKTIKRGKARA